MFLALYLTGAILVSGPSRLDSTGQQYFKDLSRWREQFESVLKVPTTDIGYTSVDSETLGGGHGEGCILSGLRPSAISFRLTRPWVAM